jgi:hypothetical protein
VSDRLAGFRPTSGNISPEKEKVFTARDVRGYSPFHFKGMERIFGRINLARKLAYIRIGSLRCPATFWLEPATRGKEGGSS